MPVEVPFLADNEIEAAAQQLLTDYAHAKAHVSEPPVPIERIDGGTRCRSVEGWGVVIGL